MKNITITIMLLISLSTFSQDVDYVMQFNTIDRINTINNEVLTKRAESSISMHNNNLAIYFNGDKVEYIIMISTVEYIEIEGIEYLKYDILHIQSQLTYSMISSNEEMVLIENNLLFVFYNE